MNQQGRSLTKKLISAARKGSSQPETTDYEEDVNLSIKVAKSLRQHWAAEAKRQGTTLKAAITDALNTKFGKPE